MNISLRCWTLAAVLLSACGDQSYTEASPAASGPAPVTPVTPPTPTPAPRRTYAACYDPAVTTAPAVAGHACTWWHAALMLQNRLDEAQPFQNSLWLATHNSANSSAYPGVSSSGDPNHSLTIPEQLQLDMRALELDVHWYPHTASAGMAPVLCHALGAETNHQGCGSTDRHLREGLREIATFLRQPENREVLLMVDIEDQLAEFVPPNSSRSNAAAHTAAITAIETELGTLVFKPTQGGGCQAMPLTLTKAAVLATGAQVILTSGCGGNHTGWNNWVFDIGYRRQKGNDGFAAPPDCGAPFFTSDHYLTSWTRVWHDSTELGARTNASLRAIDAPTLESMLACGLHMPSLDELRPNDVRAQASIWSWAVNEPGRSSAAQCARLQSDGRFHAAACTGLLPYACRMGNSWRITAAIGAQNQGSSTCTAEFPGSRYSVPATGAENRALNTARSAVGATSVWLHYRDELGVGDWRIEGE